MNAILYGPRRHRWAMTERSARALQRDASNLIIGPSSLARDGSTLMASIDEVTVPIPGRLRGRIRIALPFTTHQCYPLDPAGEHRWWPVAPAVRVEVTMDSPDLAWEGTGYFDCNAGTVPLESTFRGWHWCRAAHADGGSTVLYNTEPRAGEATRLALRFDPGGAARNVPAPGEIELPPTRVWRVKRRAGCDPGDPPRVHETLEDTPFYARSKLGLNLGGERVTCMHESLDLDRFDRRWVQTLLPFRMPRRS
jgi:carotenoid 1,2-hydratase